LRSAADPDTNSRMVIDSTPQIEFLRARFQSPDISLDFGIVIRRKLPDQPVGINDPENPCVMIDAMDLNMALTKRNMLDFDTNTRLVEYLVGMVAFINRHFPLANAPLLWSDYTRIRWVRWLYRMPSDDELLWLSVLPDHEDRRAAKSHMYLALDEKPPGAWITNERGAQIWQGPPMWRTRHGDAVVAWSFGRPCEAWDVLCAGTRIDIRRVMEGWRRRASGQRRWLYGTMEIRPDDVLFGDGPQPVYEPPASCDDSNPELDLANDAAFRADLREWRFAQAAYLTLRSRDFMKIDAGKWWTCGDRQAARIAAYLGDCGDSYQDYFPNCDLPGTPPDDRPWHASRIDERLEGVITGRILIVGKPPSDQRPADALEVLRRFKDTKIIEVPPDHYFYRLFVRAKTEWDEIFANSDVFVHVHQHITRLGWRRKRNDERRSERLV
jgi:hypothetical protein